MELYLDGLNLLNERIEYNAAYPGRLFPLTIVANGLLLTARTAIVQPIRGATTFTAGVLTLSLTQMIRGSLDILSAVIQIVVIPFFAMAAVFAPKWAQHKLTRLRYEEAGAEWDVERINGHMITFKELLPASLGRAGITGFLRGVTAAPIVMADAILLTLVKLISLQLFTESLPPFVPGNDLRIVPGASDELKKLPYVVAAPFIGLATTWFIEPRRLTNEFHGLSHDLK